MSTSVFRQTNGAHRHLGTFLGVYTPTVLTILGVIMYLRFGWLLGHMGLERTLLIVLFANAITLVTTLSFSSVATNTKLGGGGAYYIISRSLGPEIGGAVGAPLFLSQAFSVTLYAFGLAESLRIILLGIPIQLTAFLIVVIVAIIAFSKDKDDSFEASRTLYERFKVINTDEVPIAFVGIQESPDDPIIEEAIQLEVGTSEFYYFIQQGDFEELGNILLSLVTKIFTPT